MQIDRREILAALAASAVANMQAQDAEPARSFLELKVWRMHNSAEDQEHRVAAFLKDGLTPALARSGAKLIGAFGNVISSDGPFYVTLSQFDSLAAFGHTLAALNDDHEYQSASEELSKGQGLPFVRVDSSLLQSLAVMPQPAVETPEHGSRVFEWRTYQSQSFATLRRKAGMFNEGEAAIFKRLGFRPVFFAETLVGPKQPNLMYMVSYENLAAHDQLWGAFGKDPEWQKLRARPGLSDADIVANISNVILRPLPFSAVR